MTGGLRLAGSGTAVLFKSKVMSGASGVLERQGVRSSSRARATRSLNHGGAPTPSGSNVLWCVQYAYD